MRLDPLTSVNGFVQLVNHSHHLIPFMLFKVEACNYLEGQMTCDYFFSAVLHHGQIDNYLITQVRFA